MSCYTYQDSYTRTDMPSNKSKYKNKQNMQSANPYIKVPQSH
uniref:Uncharacterized protein n=1 Tax=Rhizophora mucronata TaxID=61149 RepID=A0A2P2QSY4_RHIMU